MSATPSLLSRCPVVPVVVLDDASQAVPLGRALLDGGISVVEVTLRTEAGLAGVRALADEPGLADLHVGAGSVLVGDDVDAVADAGARFVVSPGLSGTVLDRCARHHLEALPGTATSSDLMAACERGLRSVKVFPAGLLGGPAMLAALAAPFPRLSFMPSGGVSAATMADYLALPCVPAVSGSWMVAPELLRAGDWAEVTRRSADAVRRAREALGA